MVRGVILGNLALILQDSGMLPSEIFGTTVLRLEVKLHELHYFAPF